jgi:hypothetical protein
MATRIEVLTRQPFAQAPVARIVRRVRSGAVSTWRRVHGSVKYLLHTVVYLVGGIQHRHPENHDERYADDYRHSQSLKRHLRGDTSQSGEHTPMIRDHDDDDG